MEKKADDVYSTILNNLDTGTITELLIHNFTSNFTSITKQQSYIFNMFQICWTLRWHQDFSFGTVPHRLVVS